MNEHQKTTAIQLKAGSIPVNEHTKIEKVVVVDANGNSLQDLLDDYESRLATLEGA